jgi:threonine/homoserine/homoserine lactone efflux protein
MLNGVLIMLPLDVAALFFTTSIVLALAPGPDNLFVLAQSAQHGKRAGLVVTGGLCTGVLVHTAAVSFGVAAIFQTSVVAFTLLKYFGAGYLLYLAWMSFRAGGEKGNGSKVNQISMGKLYRRGIIMNVTNPKVSLFFLAFLPQFVDPEYGPIIPQMLMLGLLFIFSAVIIFGAISLLAGGFGETLTRSKRARKILNRLAGTVFAGLAIKLVFLQR